MLEQLEKIIRDRFASVPREAALAVTDCQSTAEIEAVFAMVIGGALEDVSRTLVDDPALAAALRLLGEDG